MYLVLSLLFFRSFARCFSPYLKLFMFFVRVFASLLFSVFMFLVSLLRSLLSVVIAFFPSLILFVFLSCVPPPHPPFKKTHKTQYKKKGPLHPPRRVGKEVCGEREPVRSNVAVFSLQLHAVAMLPNDSGSAVCCADPVGGRRNLGGDAESKSGGGGVLSVTTLRSLLYQNLASRKSTVVWQQDCNETQPARRQSPPTSTCLQAPSSFQILQDMLVISL